jgi:hypothetical protein
VYPVIKKAFTVLTIGLTLGSTASASSGIVLPSAPSGGDLASAAALGVLGVVMLAASADPDSKDRGSRDRLCRQRRSAPRRLGSPTASTARRTLRTQGCVRPAVGSLETVTSAALGSSTAHGAKYAR